MRSEFKYATQIYVNPIHFEIQLILKTGLFSHTRPDYQNWWNREKFSRNSFIRYFLRSDFKSATQIYVNPIHFEIQLILKTGLFHIPGPYDQNRWNRKNCPKFLHRVIFAFWIQICNPNLCKSHIFWITANIEKLYFFAYPDLMTKIDEIGKIARNSFIG